jgi:hypothetical protein
MNGFTHPTGTPQQRHLSANMQDDRLPAGLLVSLYGKAVRLAVKESANFVLKSFKVEVRPVELRGNASERVLGIDFGHGIPLSHG